MEALGFSPLEAKFVEALVLILIACVVVPVFKRIGLGTILGYLAAGEIASRAGSTAVLYFSSALVAIGMLIILVAFRPEHRKAAAEGDQGST